MRGRGYASIYAFKLSLVTQFEKRDHFTQNFKMELLGYVRVTYSIGERAKQLVKVICTLTKPKILQWLWQLHTQEAV